LGRPTTAKLDQARIRAASLYFHYATKDVLLEAVAADVLTNVDTSPREATMIGAAAEYLVFGAALGSFAEGFAADPGVYAGRYPHLMQAHPLAARAAEVDRESFEFALGQLIAGLPARYAREMS
jgi:hypothetical protein